MPLKCLFRMALGLVFLVSMLPAGLAAQTSSSDTDKKIADLEKQLEAIHAELEALKPKTATPAADAAPAAAAVATPEAATAPAAAAILIGMTLVFHQEDG